MISQRLANIVFACLTLIAIAYMAWLAKDFEAQGLFASYTGLPPWFFPILTLGLMAAFCLVIIVCYAKFGEMGGDAGAKLFDSNREALRGIATLAVAVVGFVLWWQVGFFAMVSFTPLAAAAAMGARHPLIYITIAVLTGVVYAIFRFGLGIQF